MIASSNRIRKLSALTGALFAFGLAGAMPAPASAADTAVSLTFKDTLISQYAARQILADHGMNGTFFVNSGLVLNRAADVTGRMSWRQISDLASDGNEIGGGGLTRTNLVGLSDAQLQAEICDDRDELARRGYAPASFGYPFGSDHNATTEAKVQQCGYESARSVGGVGSGSEPKAEPIPPANPFATRTRGQVDETDTLADIQSWVTEAESSGGGWVQLLIHSVCADPGCSITPANLDALLDWLQLRQGSGTEVKTVREVMTGTDQPQPRPFLDATISLTFDDGLDDHYDFARPALAANGLQGTFYINSGRIGEDTTRFMSWSEVNALANAGHEIGGHAMEHDSLVGLPEDELEEQICGDREEIIDRGIDGDQTPVSFAYPRGEHDQAAKDMVQDCGYSSARWTEGLKWYTRTSRCQFLSCPFDEQIHPLDPYKVRTVGSFGTVDNDVERYKQTVRNLEDSGGGWIPLLFHEICPGPNPNTSGCPEENSSTTPELLNEFLDWLADREATHGTEVKTVEQVMTGPAEPRAPVDTTDPVSQIRCDGSPCTSQISGDPVSVTLSATDAGGSGLAEIRYTTDGTLPTGSSPVYSGPISVTQTRTIRWRASDNHGNVEQLRSQLVQIQGPVDDSPPVSSIECDGVPCQGGFYDQAVSATLEATDTGGSGVKEIRYTTDGSNPTAAGQVYTGAINVAVTTTIKFRAEDNAGNLEAPQSETIQITPPAAPPAGQGDDGVAGVKHGKRCKKPKKPKAKRATAAKRKKKCKKPKRRF